MSVEIDERFQRLAALQATEHILKQGPQLGGIDGVEDCAHLRIARDALDAVDRAKVVAGILSPLVKREQRRKNCSGDCAERPKNRSPPWRQEVEGVIGYSGTQNSGVSPVLRSEWRWLAI